MEKILFCRKCGAKLSGDSLYCNKCGTVVRLIENDCEDFKPKKVPTGNSSAGEEAKDDIYLTKTVNDILATSISEKNTLSDNAVTNEQKKSKGGLKILLGSFVSLVAIVMIIATVIHFWPQNVVAKDIDSIYGCPEFFNVEFGMSAKEASELITVDHEVITSLESPLIYFEEDMKFDLYGIPVKDVYCGFDVLTMDSVFIIFSKDDTSLNAIIDLYKKIYGEPSDERKYSATWEGAQTTIDIYDSELLDSNNCEIIVLYMVTPNSKFTAFSFDGSEIDPCGFLTENYIFDKQPSFYISGLKKGDDYNVENHSAEGFASFSKYTFYPRFEYMGIEENTAVEFTVNGKESAIDSVSYLFLLDEGNATNRLNYIYDKLTEIYGVYEDCSYTSMSYSDIGIVELGYDEWNAQIAKGIKGIYHIQWNDNGNLITLGLTIDPDLLYFKGSVTFSG